MGVYPLNSFFVPLCLPRRMPVAQDILRSPSLPQNHEVFLYSLPRFHSSAYR